MEHSILFVHIGPRIPFHLRVAVEQVRCFNRCPVYLLAPRAAHEALGTRALDVTAADVESLATSTEHLRFRAGHRLDATFRDGFLIHASERFFLIQEFMEQRRLENVFHLENDVMLYADLEALLPVFRMNYPGLAAPFASFEFCIPGLVYARDADAVRRLTTFINEYHQLNRTAVPNDMFSLAAFAAECGPSALAPLPTVPEGHPLSLPVADPAFFSQHLSAFGSIFDAAAIGQYLGGLDPLNAEPRKSSVGFINTDSVLDPSTLTIKWTVDSTGRRVPMAGTALGELPINCLHIHSKNLQPFLSTNQVGKEWGKDPRKDRPFRLEVDGWRGLPHSYAVVNQFQLLELLRHPEVRLTHSDVPLYNPNWPRVQGTFSGAEEQAIDQIPTPGDEPPDAVYRISFPYDFTPPASGARLFVFGTSEMCCIPPHYIVGERPLPELLSETPSTMIIAPSRWSAEGFVRAGVPQDRLRIIPHGIDPKLFYPMSPQERGAIRARFGWSTFVFLAVGFMGTNKGIRTLLKAFGRVAERRPFVRLLLKGMDALYPSAQLLEEAKEGLTPAQRNWIDPRVQYLGQPLFFGEMARLYNAADAYVSPYLAEGFNLPVLEAAACGCPIICTRGGPTDDFVSDAFALRIDSQLGSQLYNNTPGVLLIPSEESLVEKMLTVVDRPDFRQRARQAGPAHIHANFTWKHVVDRLLATVREP